MDVVAAGPWLMATASEFVELSAELPDWDYDSVLRLRRPMRVDGLRARRSTGLGPDSTLVLSVLWSSSSSGLRGRVWQQVLPADDEMEVEIAFDLPGDELGGQLDLETVVTLGYRGIEVESAAAPTRPGSVLWRDVRSALLQGDNVLFPLAVADFQQLVYPTGASWHLELGQNLDAQALGSILLLANKRREAVVNALTSAGDPSDADRRVLSVVRSDVIRSLIERAIVDDVFDMEEDYPAGSIGALLVAVVRNTFPDRTLEMLRRERSHEPIRFATRLQSATDLLATA
ncbi:hypothetical protein WCD74_03080 [Actinomycetospora sp. OC33-EN08]|uniref:Uncharacterized protein n=1 Tax=Actinomycetospora aurantiaca TaxID=3129233 RepID=A0ABU8MJC1_9PSEU